MKRSSVFKVFVIFTTLVAVSSCNLPAEPSGEESTLEPTIPPRDACVVGYWWMDTGALDLLVATLIPMPNIRVPDGVLALTIESVSATKGSFDYSGNVTIHIDLDVSAGSYMEGRGLFSRHGAYTLEGDTIVFEESESQDQMVEWHAYANGTSVEAPGEAGPRISFIPEGPAPYRCTDGGLEIEARGPSGPVTMFFTRDG